MWRTLHVLTAASLLALSTVAMAVTIHVPADQPTIQAGIDAAFYGDTVVVAGGTYYEHNIMMKSGVCLRSETGSAHSVTIDAQQHDLWAFVIACMDTDESTSIVGFTMTGGYYANGAGVWCWNSSLTLRNVSFTDNYADYGGGLYCLNSSVLLENVTFLRNRANLAGGGVFGCDGSALTLTNCVLAENVASPSGDSEGGGIYCGDSSVTVTDCYVVVNEGSGMHCVDSETVVTGSTFASNTGRGLVFDSPEGGGACTVKSCRFEENAGGGMSSGYGSGDVTITDCLFDGNSADWGGGLYACSFSSTAVVGCTFTGNEADYGGAVAIENWHSSEVLSGCTIVGNHAALYGGAVYRVGNWGWGNVVIASTVIAFNTGEYPLAVGGNSDISCSDIWGNDGGDWVGLEHLMPNYGNICENPLFCGDENSGEPYTLQENSPCAAGNNPDCGQIGAWGVGCEAVTPVQTESWGSIKAMFR